MSKENPPLDKPSRPTDLTEHLSDYEYFQFSPTRAPPTPSTPQTALPPYKELASPVSVQVLNLARSRASSFNRSTIYIEREPEEAPLLVSTNDSSTNVSTGPAEEKDSLPRETNGQEEVEKGVIVPDVCPRRLDLEAFRAPYEQSSAYSGLSKKRVFACGFLVVTTIVVIIVGIGVGVKWKHANEQR